LFTLNFAHLILNPHTVHKAKNRGQEASGYRVEFVQHVESLLQDADSFTDSWIVGIVWRQMHVLLEVVDTQLAKTYLQQPPMGLQKLYLCLCI